jgi:hypothetical protein
VPRFICITARRRGRREGSRVPPGRALREVRGRLLLITAAGALAGCGAGTRPAPIVCPGGSPGVEASGAVNRRPIAQGVLHVPGLPAPERADHVFSFGQDLRKGATARRGDTLILTLRDVGRPRSTCANDHPLSGCATIDWFGGEPGRRGRPLSNSVTIDLASGPHTFYLRETGALSDHLSPAACLEASRDTALGGVARRWVGTLPAPLEPSGGISFRLFLSKFGAPDVRIGYAVRVER